MGGTCVIRGCVPKKLFVMGSHVHQEIEDAAGFGWTIPTATFDWPTLIANKDKEIARLEAAYTTNVEKSGAQVVKSRAVFEDAHTLRLADGKKVTSKYVLIATGGRPAHGPPLPGHELAIDSNGFFELDALPPRVVVQGAGYIALELACVMRLLGADVDVVVRGETLLRGFDADVQQHLQTELGHAGVKFHWGRHITRLDASTTGKHATLDNGEELQADCVLRALGRKPNTSGLGLEAAGLHTDLHGAIPVNAYSQTTVPHIYAVGDVTNRVNLTPMAIREGHAFADTVFGNMPRAVDHRLVPTAVFTTPEIGVVGLTEEAALREHPQLDVYLSMFRPMKATLSGHSARVMLKLLVDRQTDRVVGFHAVGPDTGEMAQLMGVALQMKVTKSALDATLAVHPTIAEEIVTMRTPFRSHNGPSVPAS